MRPWALALAVALAGLALAGPAAGEGGLTWSPDPVPPDTPVTVRFDAPAGAVNATLKVCLAEEGVALFCFPLAPMTRGDDGAFTATTDPRWGFPADQQVGFNVTWVDAEGLAHYMPEGEPDPARAYVFLTTLPAERGAPGPAAGIALVGLAVAARSIRRRQ